MLPPAPALPPYPVIECIGQAGRTIVHALDVFGFAMTLDMSILWSPDVDSIAAVATADASKV